MQVRVPTNHHFYDNQGFSDIEVLGEFGLKDSKKNRRIIDDLFSGTFEITNRSEGLEQLQIFGFKKSKSRLDDDPELILRIFTREYSDGARKFVIQTGLFAGVVFYKGVQFNIVSRNGDTFLKRMLNFVNDIYIDNTEINSRKSDEKNEFLNIIAYLFVQSLERASVLGLPKTFQSKVYRGPKVKGKIDFNAYLKNDIPFTGMLTSRTREQLFIQEIIDVLFMAARILERKLGKEITRRIFSVYQELKQNYSGLFPGPNMILSAKNNAVLQNPLYAPFKQVLTYAEIIINENNLLISNESDSLKTHGYLFDISQLFEVYLEKLLNRSLENWSISGQEEILAYEGNFFQRKMYPDLVLRNLTSEDIVVLDAKCKNMDFVGRDLDRSDFYQIHSYMTYYQPKVILGGLIYPLNSDLQLSKAHANNVFDNSYHKTQFIVDGIFVTNSMTMKDIQESEMKFINRLLSSLTNREVN